MMQAKLSARRHLPSGAASGVFLRSTWVLTTLRHPALRLLGCLTHLLCCFLLLTSSPLLSSLHTPARFPVYGVLVHTATTGFTWQKLIFQGALVISLLLLLRFVAYPRLVQRQWNWRHAHHHAARTFSRLSRASESDLGEEATLGGRHDMMDLHTFIPGIGSAKPAVRLHVWNVGSSHGSWTFVAALLPLLWSAVMFAVKNLVGGTALGSALFPEHHSGAWNNVRQLELQKALSSLLLLLSCLKLAITTDWVFQDSTYARVLFGNWMSVVRRVYTGIPAVRLLWCWSCLVGIILGGLYFDGMLVLLNQWIAWRLEEKENDAKAWLLNASWLAMLSATVVALDILWLAQDFEFPSFTTPLSIRIFGLPMDQFTLRLFRVPLSFTSKWVGGFLVVAVVLPFELCQFLQVVTYSPGNYSQYANATTFRVLPTNTANVRDIGGFDMATQKMLEVGSLSTYFAWSTWDRVPAVAVLLLCVYFFVWFWRRERCKMCYSVFLGLSSAKEEQADAVARLNVKLPLTTKRSLNTQRRLRTLYKLRARSDSFCIGLAMLSVITVWMQFRAIWRSSLKYQQDVPLQSPGETYAALLLLITFVMLHQLHHRYYLKMEILALRNQIPPDYRRGLWQSPRLLLLPFLAEVLLCGIFLPPMIHGRVHLNEERYALPRGSLSVVPACPEHLKVSPTNRECDLQYSYPLEIVNMVVLVRLYWFARVVRNQLLRQVTTIPIATGIPLIHAQDVPIESLGWSFRISFALRPAKMLLTLFALLWVSTAAAVSIFERPFPSKLDGEDHALWLTLVTMTGVGYGDTYPITSSGRAAIVLGAVIGGLGFISLMTSEFLETIKGGKRESTILKALESLRWERDVRNAAQRLICIAWREHRRLHIDRKKPTLDKVLRKAAQLFKRCRKQRPNHTTGAFHLQTGEASTTLSCDWMRQRHAETLANLDKLEGYVDGITKSINSLL